jgi:CheY-like chemotaxis protein
MAERENCILVVDDHPPLLAALKELLEFSGYRAVTALSGEEALRLMDDVEVPALIVADVLMPQMDGYAFYEAVRARPECASIPFLFLTTQAGGEEVLKARAIGVQGYITKPFDYEDLLRAIASHLVSGGGAGDEPGQGGRDGANE